jgi:hypothetical protein
MSYLDHLASFVLQLGPQRRSRSRDQRRREDLRNFVMGLARDDFESRYPDLRFAPVVVLLAAYLEADNIGDVLKRIPDEACGLPISVLVVVDGGDDGTEKIVTGMGAHCAAFPVNMGHGLALRLGYQLASEKGASYVITMDADGQDDPASVPDLLAPLVAGTSDFVIASRRLGTDESTDAVRRAGTVFFAAVINSLTHQHLTDTSMGLRALRIDVLNDVTLEQDQYQTAELVISAASRGWRISEVPTVRHPRTSGESKKGHNAFFGLQYARVILRTWLREHSRR